MALDSSASRAPHASTPAPASTSCRPPIPHTADIDLLYARPGFLLRRAHQISVSVFEGACSELALTPGQFAVLTVLQVDSSLDQSSVARAIGLDKVTVSLLLRGLELRGLVDRRVATGNRRKRSLSLTEAGHEILRLSHAPAEAAYETLMAPFDAKQRQQFTALLRQLVMGLEHCARATLEPLPQSATLR